MTRRRWIADEFSSNRAALTGAHADHLVRVLRARVGEEFDVIANGIAHRARVANVAADRVDFDLAEALPAAPAANLILLLSIFKFDRMEWAIEKCTELGVSKIIPVIARRSDTHLASAAAKRAERWRRIALQASEQSRRAEPPEIAAPIKLKDAIAITGKLRIVLSESEQQIRLRDIFSLSEGGDAVLAVGPEGGWTEDELRAFQVNGWSSATLGSTILRAETAAIAAAAVCISWLNE